MSVYQIFRNCQSVNDLRVRTYVFDFQESNIFVLLETKVCFREILLNLTIRSENKQYLKANKIHLNIEFGRINNSCLKII